MNQDKNINSKIEKIEEIKAMIETWKKTQALSPYGGMILNAIVCQTFHPKDLLEMNPILSEIQEASLEIQTKLRSYEDEFSRKHEPKLFVMAEDVFKKLEINWNGVLYV